MDRKTRITVALPLSPEQQEQLLNAAPQATFRFCDYRSITEEDVRDAQILMGRIPAELCCKAKELIWLQSQAAGPDSYLKPGVLKESVLLTTASGAYGLAVAEHMLAMTLMLMKRLHSYRDAQHRHAWESLGQVKTLYKSNVLVLGMGDLGGSYSKYCHQMGATVIGIRRSSENPFPWVEKVCPLSQLEEVLPWADVVANCLPHSPHTAGLLGTSQFALMKPGAILMNGGRGSVLDTQALLEALRTGSLGGAGLDVTDPEPLPENHPLWEEPNALITPHIAGLFHLPETVQRLTDLFCENLIRYFAGEPLRNLVGDARFLKKAGQKL